MFFYSLGQFRYVVCAHSYVVEFLTSVVPLVLNVAISVASCFQCLLHGNSVVLTVRITLYKSHSQHLS